MAGGRSATNRALLTCSTQALIDDDGRRGVRVSCVYLVVAGAVCEPQTLIPLAPFSSESLVQTFIDFAPSPQRRCLGIQRWEIDQPTRDPFWTGTEIGPYLNKPRSIFDETKASSALPLDRAFLRFREKLLLYTNDWYGDSSDDQPL
jgi:hypothetical protein